MSIFGDPTASLLELYPISRCGWCGAICRSGEWHSCSVTFPPDTPPPDRNAEIVAKLREIIALLEAK